MKFLVVTPPSIYHIELHDVVQMFRLWRGTGTATLEAKILKEITGMRKEVLCEIFIYIHMSNDSQ